MNSKKSSLRTIASKLELGTAQFGMDYGIANDAGKVNERSVSEILDFAFQSGITTIDTAANYGSSEEVLGSCLKSNDSRINIISKLPKVQNSSQAIQYLNATLTRLQTNQLHGYLFHDFETFIQNPRIYDDLKKDRRAGKIGFSVYSPNQINTLLKMKIKIEIIQFPYNIFDHRFEHLLASLHDLGCEIHVRSVFLQGIVFKKTNELSNYFKDFIPLLDDLRTISLNNRLTVAELCLSHVLQNNYINNVVVGVNNLANLKDLVSIEKKAVNLNPLNTQLNNMKTTDERFLLPMNWR